MDGIPEPDTVAVPEAVLEADEFLEGEPVEGPLNVLLEPNTPVVPTDEDSGYGPGTTGYRDRTGYDRQVLEKVYRIASDLDDPFSAHSELIHGYSDPYAEGGRIGEKGREQVRSVWQEAVKQDD